MRPIVEIIRLEEDFLHGTFGVLRIDKAVFCVTLEPSDRLNMPDHSFIPPQQYDCTRWNSPKYGETFKVMHVPTRTDILFHPGNTIEDTGGCILLGQYFGKLKGDRAVLNSGATFKNFMRVMQGEDYFHLTVKEEY